MRTDLQALAVRQWHDYRTRQPGTHFGEAHPALSRDEAYAVQIAVADLRCQAGDAVAGYKVGCIGPGMVEQFGMSGPIHARLFRSELKRSGAILPYDGYANLAIEGEMAVRIGADGAIEAAFPVIELHHFVFRGTPKSLPELIANNGINAGAVLPQAIDRPPDHWVGTLSVRLNGRTIDEGGLWSMPGGAAEAVDWLRDDLRRHELTLRPGEIVLTGTPLGLYPVAPGDHVEVTIGGIPLVECHIEPRVSRWDR
jgi:2-keto-4-pentenoate hydratase